MGEAGKERRAATRCRTWVKHENGSQYGTSAEGVPPLLPPVSSPRFFERSLPVADLPLGQVGAAVFRESF